MEQPRYATWLMQALGAMNRSMNIMSVQRILQEFERESSTMDMKDEMMNDTMEDALGEEDAMGEGIGEDEESDTILREVLDEIGVSVNQKVRFHADAARQRPRQRASTGTSQRPRARRDWRGCRRCRCARSG